MSRWEKSEKPNSKDPFGPNPLNEKYDKVMEEYRYKGGTEYFKYCNELDSNVERLLRQYDCTVKNIADKLDISKIACKISDKLEISGEDLDIKKTDYEIIKNSLDRLAKRGLIRVVGSEPVENGVLPIYSSAKKPAQNRAAV